MRSCLHPSGLQHIEHGQEVMGGLHVPVMEAKSLPSFASCQQDPNMPRNSLLPGNGPSMELMEPCGVGRGASRVPQGQQKPHGHSVYARNVLGSELALNYPKLAKEWREGAAWLQQLSHRVMATGTQTSLSLLHAVGHPQGTSLALGALTWLVPSLLSPFTRGHSGGWWDAGASLSASSWELGSLKGTLGLL